MKGRGSMAKEEKTFVKVRSATTPEQRENQLIALAMDRAEEQLRNGTASSQVITHFLKLGSTKERQEKEKLEEEVKLLRAKTKSYESAETNKELYEEAIRAFTKYSGEDEYD